MPVTIGSGTWFFLALPDSAGARAVAERVLPSSQIVVDHPSGRPWLLGRFPPQQAVVHREGPNRLALLGSTAAEPAQVARASDGLRSVGDAAEVSAQFAGNYCVVGSVGGRVYAQGSAVGVRRVFHALVDGVRVVCDRADVLAELGGLVIDETALALRLVRYLPHPFQEVPLWHGLQPVAPEDYVVLERNASGWRSGTWWRRPEPLHSRSQGAERLRDALENAVHARTASGAQVACDLSGGMDSTPLCYFAAQGPTGVLARTTYTHDPGGRQDLDWAGSALPSMPGVREHVVESVADMPDFFGGLLAMEARLDEPSQAAMAGPRIVRSLADDTARGIATRLNGVGGDHLLCSLPPWEHSLFRQRPLLAWRRARALHVPDGHRISTTLRELLTVESYRAWLHKTITAELSGVSPPELPRISDWSPPLRLPPWLSGQARAALTVKLREVASAAEPLAPHRAGHLELSMLRAGARTARGTSQLGQSAGVAYDAPLLDDHVAEAVLAVRREERDTPIEWKPLMKTAMGGLLPDAFLRRTTKIGGAPQAVRGIAANQEELQGLWDSSGLPALGLVDTDELAAATRPDPTAMPSPHLFDLVNTAVFLRNPSCRPARTDLGTGGPR